MAYRFPSEEWVKEYQRVINSSEDYKKSGRLDGGPFAWCFSEPFCRLDKEIGIWLVF